MSPTAFGTAHSAPRQEFTLAPPGQRHFPQRSFDAPCVPPALSLAAREARARSYPVIWFEMPGRRGMRLCIEVEAPWTSDIGRQLKESGAHETTLNAFLGPEASREGFAWYEPDLPTPTLFKLISSDTGTHVADGVLWHDGACDVHYRMGAARSSSFASQTDLERACEETNLRVDWPAATPR